MAKVVVVGAGYIGRRVVNRLINDGHDITATFRHVVGQSDPAVRWRTLDLDSAIMQLPTITADTLILYLVPPPGHGQNDPRLRKFFDYLEKSENIPARFVYVSSTAVYGDANGAWVDETTIENPSNDRGRRRLDAESQVKSWCGNHTVDWIILRVAGIYGPQRLPIKTLQRGQPVLLSSEAPASNRVHAADVVQASLSALFSPVNHETYNVTDGNPCSRTEFYQQVATLAGLPPLEERSINDVWADLNETQRIFLHDSRRVSNEKLVTQLLRATGNKLKYPELRQGIADSLVEMGLTADGSHWASSSPTPRSHDPQP